MAAITRKARLSIRSKADINITPLIDVLLVLIVIFMVITPVPPRGLQSEVPQPSPLGLKPHPADETLVLSLDRDGDLRLNSDVLEPQDLFARLNEALRTRSDRTLFVRADDEVLYQDVAVLIDTARSAGAIHVGLMGAGSKQAR